MNVVEDLLRRAAGVFLTAVASLVVAWFVLVALSILGMPPFASEAGAGFVAAAVWVFLGVQMAESRGVSFPALLFALGALFSWCVIRGVVRDLSPYTGLFELACTYAGGGCGLILVFRRVKDMTRASLAASLLMPVASTLIVGADALHRPQYGNLGYVWSQNRQIDAVRFVWMNESGTIAIWTYGDVSSFAEAIRSGSIDVETDPGSGPTRAAAAPIRDPGELERVRRTAEASMVSRIEWQVEHGFVPGFLELPYRSMPAPTSPVVRAETHVFD